MLPSVIGSIGSSKRAHSILTRPTARPAPRGRRASAQAGRRSRGRPGRERWACGAHGARARRRCRSCLGSTSSDRPGVKASLYEEFAGGNRHHLENFCDLVLRLRAFYILSLLDKRLVILSNFFFSFFGGLPRAFTALFKSFVDSSSRSFLPIGFHTSFSAKPEHFSLELQTTRVCVLSIVEHIADRARS
jgi:hypothetical protein